MTLTLYIGCCTTLALGIGRLQLDSVENAEKTMLHIVARFEGGLLGLHDADTIYWLLHHTYHTTTT